MTNQCSNDQCLNDGHGHWSFGLGHSLVILVCSFLIPSLGCERVPELVVYSSVDEPYAAPIFAEFQTKAAIRVRLVTDTEASKSVGLAERLRAEKANPQCDVWWGNEPFHTINLAEEGLLQAYESPNAKDINSMYRDPQNRWAGNGLRARVIAVAEGAGEKRSAASIRVLGDPGVKGRIAMARPTAGTTGGHVAALYVLWGEANADSFFRLLRTNEIKLLGGNGPVAEAVGQNSIALGLTDNDDVSASQRERGKLYQLLPDQEMEGTLMIPTTIGLVAGTKQQELAKQLIDHLLSAQVEQKLIDAKFAGWSVRKSNDVKAMQVDYREVARMLPTAVRRATEILEGRQ